MFCDIVRICMRDKPQDRADISKSTQLRVQRDRSQWYKLTLAHINPHELSTDNSYNVMIFRKINRIGHVNGTVYRLRRRDAPSSVKAWLMRSPLWFIHKSRHIHHLLLEGILFPSVIRAMEFFTLRLQLLHLRRSHLGLYLSRLDLSRLLFSSYSRRASCAVPISVRSRARAIRWLRYTYTLLYLVLY